MCKFQSVLIYYVNFISRKMHCKTRVKIQHTNRLNMKESKRKDLIIKYSWESRREWWEGLKEGHLYKKKLVF